MPSKLPWPRTAAVYQIYPRSFKDSNGDGVGDLGGIIEKLDYLEWLGVGAVWMSPICKSPMKDFGYDVENYQEIDPLFGTMEDFDVLVKKAHSKNIKIIMDLVPNHTSDRHEWFLESKSAKKNPKRNWYLWADGKSGDKPPNNWLSVFGGSGWERDELTGQYYYHSFLKEQPDLNWREPEVLEAFKSIMRFWLKKGVDGFRVDAVHWLVKDKQLRNNPVNPGYQAGSQDPYHQFINIYSQGQPETIKILGEFCKLLGEYKDRFMVTELHAGIDIMQKYFRACENGLHSPFNFNFIGMPWDALSYKTFVNSFEASLLEIDWPNYVLGNHDQSRVVSRLGMERARLLALLQFTLRGMPFVYYGEEMGMEDVVVPPELVQDPFEKHIPGLRLGRDPQRSPMQWDGAQYAGFSAARPWLPVNPNYQHINVEVEQKDSRSMLTLYRSFIALRTGSEALLFGKYEEVDAKNEKVYAFTRSIEGENKLIVLNFGDQNEYFEAPFSEAEVIINTHLDRPAGERINLKDFNLRPFEGYLLQIEK